MTNAPLPSELKLKPRTLALITGGGFLIGTLIVVGAIMPAEYHVDPLGIGKLSGIARLWAPEEKKIDTSAGAAGPLAREYDTPFRTDVIEIPLTDFLGGAKGSELEYKVHMKKDATLTYEWEAVARPARMICTMIFTATRHPTKPAARAWWLPPTSSAMA